MPPPRPPAAGEVLLGYYHITDTVRCHPQPACRHAPPPPPQAGCMQCADLNFCGCFMCVFFSLWIMTWPLAFLVCLLQPFHTGVQWANASPALQPPPPRQACSFPSTATLQGVPTPLHGSMDHHPTTSTHLHGRLRPHKPTCVRLRVRLRLLCRLSICCHVVACAGFQSGNFPRMPSNKQMTAPEPVQGIPVGSAAPSSAAAAAPAAQAPPPQTM